MPDDTPAIGLHVDIGPEGTPRLNFSLGSHVTNLPVAHESATDLGLALLHARFLSSLGQAIPANTIVPPGQLPVMSVTGHVDPTTSLPTLTFGFVGGGSITLLFTANLAASTARAVAEQLGAQPTPGPAAP